jgi:hypothetical protein
MDIKRKDVYNMLLKFRNLYQPELLSSSSSSSSSSPSSSSALPIHQIHGEKRKELIRKLLKVMS